jgi:hypothetical protein
MSEMKVVRIYDIAIMLVLMDGRQVPYNYGGSVRVATFGLAVKAGMILARYVKAAGPNQRGLDAGLDGADIAECYLIEASLRETIEIHDFDGEGR